MNGSPALDFDAPVIPTGTMKTEMGSRTSTSASSGTKRKRESGPKFYAVKVGFKPGIYHSWPDCLKQVTGYKNASFKSFTSLTDADNFLNNISPASSSKPQKYYAVQNGRNPGVYTTWADAQAQITGWKQPRHRAFQTRAEAEAFVMATPASPTEGSEVGAAKGLGGATSEDGTPLRPPKKVKANGFKPVNGTPEDLPEPGTGPLPADAEDGFDYRLKLNEETGDLEYKGDDELNATKVVQSTTGPKGTLTIYTDGSTLGNGRSGATAGIGVFFGIGDDRNLSEPLQGERQTNQRAELTAIKRALELSPCNRDVHIFSDSSYAIKCVLEWYANWQANGWQTANRKPVENRDLIEAVRAKMDERERCGVQTKLEWLKGHADHAGNVEADKLAVQGARDARAKLLSN